MGHRPLYASVVALLSLAFVACTKPSGIDGGGNSAGNTTGGPTTSGTTTSAAPGDAGYAPCAADAIWIGDRCLLTRCTVATINDACVRPGGGMGLCDQSTCIDVSNDDQNCGRLGLICPGAQTCDGGQCNGPAGTRCSEPCPTGTTCSPFANGCVTTTCDGSESGADCWSATTVGICCNGACTEPEYDSSNCGGCGVSCDGGACNFGVCEVDCSWGPDNSLCSGNNLGFCCHGQCLMLDNDAQNCGGCGRACPGGQSCIGGFCTQAVCEGQPEGSICPIDGDAGLCCNGVCVDFSRDATCGGCSGCPAGLHCDSNHGCADDGGQWTRCTASSVCPPGSSCSDEGNYGKCFPDSCAGLASGAECLLDPTGLRDAGATPFGTCCGSTCVDVQSDTQNCLACGNACPPGFACQNGCTQGGHAFYCTFGPSMGCPAGTACVVGPFGSWYGCEPVDCSALADGTPCSFNGANPGACCGGSCVFLYEDPRNCGSCGHSCGGSRCQSKVCDSDLPSDDCIPACAPGEICLVGRCLSSVCQASYYSYYITALVGQYYQENDVCVAKDSKLGICCGDGECTDPAADPMNCGECGLQCAPGKACVAGICEGSICSAGTPFGFCDPTNQDLHCCGVDCVDTSRDPLNCGNCGITCDPSMSCLAGKCL